MAAAQLHAMALLFPFPTLTPCTRPPPLLPAAMQPECTQQEAWYGTKYSAGPLPPAWLREWKEGPALPQLHLPHHNPFIPQQFDLLKVRGWR